ncbi:hypothetical protein [Mobiluncus curtisii]|uniref:hypothetical protein n=1 Tax=Mobiluncus curtisii TaxID=2051 RepID=UPI002092959D|nr:hypothetical protein [Mobiluncus curtisii]
MDPKNRLNTDEVQVNSNIARVRRRGMRLKDDYVTLSHGAGGKASAALVEQVFVSGYGNEVLDEMTRCGGASLDGAARRSDRRGHQLGGRQTRDVHRFLCGSIRWFFPVALSAELAVNGTVNDLAVSGLSRKSSALVSSWKKVCLSRICAAKSKLCTTQPKAAGVQIITG